MNRPSAEETRNLLEELLLRRSVEEPKPHPFGEYVNPHLAAVLRASRLDKRFVRGEGCWLFDDAGNRYLDFTAAYGALPFGFNPPEIWQTIFNVASAMQPSLIQPSAIDAAGELAERLISVAPQGLRYVTFANSGAESIEVAIKIARAATGRLGILSTENGFHGKTLGALSATGRTLYQQAFGAPAQGFERVPYGDVAALERVLSERAGEIAAFVVEPIQGEGGIVTPSDGYLRAIRECCSRHRVLLVLDEVQTGLGRTGYLFACDREGVSPDIMTLAKALGGGMLPLAAVLCTEACYTQEFALKHTSTFANNTLACRVGLRSLDMVTRNNRDLVRRVAENGAWLREGLEQLKLRYPALIRSVRGRGYFLGLEFTTSAASFGRQSLIASLAEQKTLVLALCSYMLNVKHIRLAPTVFGTNVLRVEPPLVATREHCEMFLAALEHVLERLECCDTAYLCAHLLDRRDVQPQPGSPPVRRVARPTGRADEGQWAFIVHPLDGRSFTDFDSQLACFSEPEIYDLVRRLNQCVLVDTDTALVLGSIQITSATSASSYGELISISQTANELLALSAADARKIVAEAVRMAAMRGARIVGLGAYTSVVTRNALALEHLDIALTTGNTYTVASTIESVERIAERMGMDLSKLNIAIVGAGGSIGRATAIGLAGRVGSLILLGNAAHPARTLEQLHAVARDVVRVISAAGASIEGIVADMAKHRRLVISSDPARDLPLADVIVTATSSTRNIIVPENIRSGAVVLDISRPSNVSPAVRQSRPDVLIIDGALIETPGRQDLGVEFGLAPGLVYACMAETMILGLEHAYSHGTIGRRLLPERIAIMRDLAAKHGFHVAGFQTAGSAVNTSDWRSVTFHR